MSCLLPQFKCPPDSLTFTAHSRPLLHHHHLHQAKELRFRAQCGLSATTMSAAVLELEKLRLAPSAVQANSNQVDANKTGADNALAKAEFLQAISGTEALLTNDEAVISAAAAEALTLANAAVKAAKEAAALMKPDFKSTNTSTTNSSTTTFSSPSIQSQLTEEERAHILGDHDLKKGLVELPESCTVKGPSDECSEPTSEELTLLEEQLQLYEEAAVRSMRQVERKVRRERASEVGDPLAVVSPRYSVSRKKKRAVKQVDHADPLRYLKAAASGSKLLSFAQECKLSEGIQDLLKLERLKEELAERYGGEPTFEQWAAAAGVDQKTLSKRLNHGSFCKDKMVTSNVRLVISIAKNYQRGLNLEDLVQDGCIGLVRAAEKFDASKGFKFSTYAHWWVKQAVRKSLYERSRPIRIPLHLIHATYKVKAATRQLEDEHGRDPTDKEIAEAAGMTMKKLEAVLAIPEQPRSSEQKIGDTDMKPVLVDPDSEMLDETIMRNSMKQELEKVLNTLTPREREVINWRFGLDGGRTKTLQEIGELVGVSRERVRQIETSAYEKLTRKKWTKQLQLYGVAQCSSSS